MSFWTQVDEFVDKRFVKRPSQQKEINDGGTKVDDTVKETTKSVSKGDSIDTESVKIDIVLITAVEDEYLAVRKIFTNRFSEVYNNGFKYCLVNYEIAQGENVVIAIFKQTNMGLVSASMTATYAANKFSPKLLLMCGVCAGVEGKSNLGDLIVFSPVFDYGSGKYDSGQFQPDYRQRQIDGSVNPIVEEMRCDRELCRKIKDAWTMESGKPETELTVHIYPGGSGAAVITDTAVMDAIKTHQRTLGAIDMEAFAIGEVANAALSKEIPWLVVKGVQDFASPLKNDQYREYAAFTSGVFIKHFIERYYEKHKSSFY